jgi:CheY-like chemotaxis protein
LSAPRVLVIDDAPGVGASVRLMLEGLCAVELARSGFEGLARLDADPPYAAVLCDLHLPDLSAELLGARLLAAHPELAPRLVLMSGALPELPPEPLAAVPLRRRLQKPFGADALLDALAAADALPQVE